MSTHRLEDWVLHKLFPKIVPSHRPLSVAENRDFLQRRALIRIEPFRAFVCLSALMLIVFSLWDWTVDSQAALRNLPLRFAAAVIICLFARQIPTYLATAQVDRMVLRFVFFYTALLSYLVSQIPQGLALGISGLLILPTTFGMLFADSRKILTLIVCWVVPSLMAWRQGVDAQFIASQMLFAVTALGTAWLGGRVHEASAERQFQLRQELEQQALTDSLTGLLNRRAVTKWAAEEFARTIRYDRPLSLLLLDIDFFKKVNDRYGHDVGDQVIVRLADTCKSALRSTDQVARWGGEEFLVVLPETSLSQALQLGERLRTSVEQQLVLTVHGNISFTVSIGIAQLESGVTFEELVDRSDQALYQAKQKGRNRTVCFEVCNQVKIRTKTVPKDCC
jgi:diguanylate cyclase (GGDEF)-like protein